MATPLKVTKTYYLINADDDLYKKGYYKYSNGQPIENPTAHGKNAVWTFRFPEQFLNSTNPRSIEVHYITLSTNNITNSNTEMMKDIVMHSSFVKRDPYLDHSVMICNQMRTKFKKYAYNSSDQTFDVWFTSFLNPNWEADYNKTTFIIEMMLIY